MAGIFLLFAVRRLYAGLNGIPYSRGRLIRMPLLYLLFTLLSVFGFGTIDIYVVSTLVLIPAGAAAGLFMTSKPSFFYVKGRVFYRRHVYIMTFWIVSYVARLVIEFTYPFNLILEIVVSGLLAATTGLIIGEVFNTWKGYNSFISGEGTARGVS